MFNNKTTLITGGTGSFGKKFIEFFFKHHKPKKLIIFSRDELKQFELSKIFTGPRYKGIRFFIGDVRDKNRLKHALRDVDYVIHAAALKQIPVAEYNPQECIKTNVIGSQNLIEACIDCGVKKVVALSTDKAADPINLYGASKLAADKLFIAANYFAANKPTIFSVVRYGNVINSRGSVIPYFKKLISDKSKFLPITDPGMTRFFITLGEGVNFVIKSFKRMTGGEIFIPKLPSIKITDLAKAMSPKIKLKIIGIRPGEKIHEVLCPRDYSHLTLEFKDHFVITPTIQLPKKHHFKKNNIGEIGSKVKMGFEYASGKNKIFLKTSEIKKIISNDSL